MCGCVSLHAYTLSPNPIPACLLLQNFNPPDFHHKLGTQQTRNGNFVRETANSGELLIDRVPPPCIFSSYGFETVDV
jgi:hypothetical protein